MTAAHKPPIDLHQWFWDSALPLWWEVGADRNHGGFEEGIDFDGHPAKLDRRLRVQARQTWVYARAHRRDPGGGWGEAANHGLAALQGSFKRADGLYHSVVALDDGPRPGPLVLYDQAFVLLAFAALHNATMERAEMRAGALALMARIVERFGHRAGGFRETGALTPFYSNPHMHLLEAMLEWENADPTGPWAAQADDIVELALERFIDPTIGAVREHFDAEWRPAPGLNGRILDVGHQFEWSWLLRRWATRRGRPDVVQLSETLFATGAQHGIDPGRGVAFNTLLDDFFHQDSSARLWPQTEWLKAAVTSAPALNDTLQRGRADQAEAALRGLSLYLRTEVVGLWHDTLSSNGEFTDSYAPASSFYHIAGAVLALDGPPLLVD